uniref:Beta-N-acetylhexosaminidase n=2 Tax=Panagrolaimus sp. ES5 TaxID=591445 RepID=A0AC34F333_9BILA
MVSPNSIQTYSKLIKSSSPIFSIRTVHLDLKGAPPKIEYFRQLMPFFKSLGFDSILMEYEDMFPYSGRFEILRTKYAYSRETIVEILKLAEDNELEIIPLIQTFGHMEFVLKHSIFEHLREVPSKPDTICPSDSNSTELIHEMLQQVRELHPNSKSIHIGCDEAWHIAQDDRCLHALNTTFHNLTDQLKLAHISSIAKYAKEHLNFEHVLAWNDLFDKIPVDLLNEYKLGSYIIPIIWGYAENVTTAGYFPPGMIERYSQVFNEMIFGSVFKGANGAMQIFVTIERYLSNLKSYLMLYILNERILNGKVMGTVLTGWQRFWHGIQLCEILPEGIPALVLESMYMKDPTLDDYELENKTLEFFNCERHQLFPISYNGKLYTPRKEAIYSFCEFPGSDVYALIEKLHLLLWKISVSSPELYNPLREEQKQLRNEFQQALKKYFYEDTVEEFIKQNIDSIIPA